MEDEGPSIRPVPSPSFEIIKNARTMLMRVIKRYFDIIIDKMGNLDILVSNPKSHLEKTTFVIMRVKDFNI